MIIFILYRYKKIRKIYTGKLKKPTDLSQDKISLLTFEYV